MSLRINTNVDALSSYNKLDHNSAAVSKSMQRLSSGFRINSAADDSAASPSRSVCAARSVASVRRRQTSATVSRWCRRAEGALSSVHGMLQRVRELAVQFQNGSLNTTDRTSIQSEVNQLASEIERIGTTTAFNGIKLLNASGTVTFQVGANDSETISVATISLGSAVGASYASLTAGSTTDLSEIDTAINNVSNQRAVLGATQNRLGYAADATNAYQENLVAAESRIRDADMAKESVSLSKNQVLVQAGTAMLAQANQSGQAVLSLLR